MKILYEDNHIIVVVKEKNLLTQSDITKDKDLLTNVKEYIKTKYNKPGNVYVGLIHRLDRMVGGVLVFAKTSKAAARLNKQIQDKKFIKNYVCLVHNKTKEFDRIENYLKKDDTLNKSFIDRTGKLSVLEYKLIKYIEDKSLLDINLITGRHHQIRVQLSNLNHPIVGDVKYGKNDNCDIKLYAYKLGFFHPTTNEYMEFIDYPEWM